MRVWTLAALCFVLLLIGSPSAFAVAHPPKPLEDVTKLEKPTLSFEKMDPVRHDTFQVWLVDADGENERLWMDAGGKTSFGAGIKWSPDGKWLVYTSFVKRGGKDVRGIYMMHIDTKEVRHVLDGHILDTRWVLAGKSRFLSVNPAGKKKAPWGALKEADGSANNPTSQDGE